MERQLREAHALANWSLQAREETIRARLYRLRHNAQLQRKALHPDHSKQLQSALHSHTLRKRPSNRCGPQSVTILSSPQRNTTHRLHGTHFTGEVYKQFCAQRSITQELHFPWRPQSSGIIERQHRTMKNALYMLCEDRSCEWTDILESVTSSMNATINSATGVSPHYAITGRHPNIGLPKLLSKEIASNDPGAYGMQINALLRQVHRVALANDEAGHKLEASLNRFIYKDPIQVGDKVLLHRSQSTIA